MQKRKSNKWFLLSFSVLLCGLIFSVFGLSINSVQAETSTSISCDETDGVYYVSAYIEAFGGDEDYTIYHVNDIEIKTQINEGISLNKCEKPYTVYAEMFIYTADGLYAPQAVDLGYEVYKTQTLYLAAIDNASIGAVIEPEETVDEKTEEEKMTEIVWKTLLPIFSVLAIVAVVLLYYAKKTVPAIVRIKKRLVLKKERSQLVLTYMQNKKYSNKAKKRRYLSFLNSTISQTKSLISTCSVLNVESMGQHSSILTNLLSFKQLLEVAKSTTGENDISKCQKVIKNIESKVLPKLITNAEQIDKTFRKLSNETKKIDSNKFFSSVEEYQKYIEKSLLNSESDDDIS